MHPGTDWYIKSNWTGYALIKLVTPSTQRKIKLIAYESRERYGVSSQQASLRGISRLLIDSPYKGLMIRIHMMTSLHGIVFRVTWPLCGESTGHRWIPHTKSSDAEFTVLFDLRVNERLSKQSWGWSFETPSCPLWRQSNGFPCHDIMTSPWVRVAQLNAYLMI